VSLSKVGFKDQSGIQSCNNQLCNNQSKERL